MNSIQNDPLPKEWINLLHHWCKSKSLIRSAWFFGSRAKGTSRPGSDLDIALDINVHPSDDNHDDTWLRVKEEWQSELSQIFPATIDLRHLHPHGLNKVVSKGIDESGILVYARTS